MKIRTQILHGSFFKKSLWWKRHVSRFFKNNLEKKIPILSGNIYFNPMTENTLCVMAQTENFEECSDWLNSSHLLTRISVTRATLSIRLKCAQTLPALTQRTERFCAGKKTFYWSDWHRNKSPVTKFYTLFSTNYPVRRTGTPASRICEKCLSTCRFYTFEF